MYGNTMNVDLEKYESDKFETNYLCDILENVLEDNNMAIATIIATYRHTYYKFNVVFDYELRIVNTDCISHQNEITLTDITDVYDISAKELVSLDNNVDENIMYSTVYTNEDTITSNSDELYYYVSNLETTN